MRAIGKKSSGSEETKNEKTSKGSSNGEDVVKVTNNVVGIVIDNIETSIRKNKSSETTESEASEEAHDDNHFNTDDVGSKQR